LEGDGEGRFRIRNELLERIRVRLHVKRVFVGESRSVDQVGSYAVVSCPLLSSCGKERAHLPAGFLVRLAKALGKITEGNAPLQRDAFPQRGFPR